MTTDEHATDGHATDEASTDENAGLADRLVGVDGRLGGVADRLADVAARRPPLAGSLALIAGPFAVAVGVFLGVAILSFVLITPEMIREAMAGAGSGGIVANDTTLDYFVNNAGTAFVLMGGMAVLTLAALAYNGLLLGGALKGGLVLGLSPRTLALALVPHSVFEIPALLLAGAIGLFLPWRLVRHWRGHRELIVDPEEELHLLQLFVVVLVLVAVAAAVEAHVTHALVAVSFESG